MDKYFDFDKFMAEKERKPVIIHIFGEDEELPPALPADITLEVMRMNADPNTVVTESQVFMLATKIFGDDRLKKWCDKGLDTEGLEVLITEVFRIYQGTDEIATTPSRKGSKKSSRK